MALVDKGYEISVTFADKGGNTATRNYAVSPETATDADTIAAAILSRVDPLTLAVVKSYRVSHVFEEDAFAYPANGEVEELAVIIAQIEGDASKKATITIPAPDPSLFVAANGPKYNDVNVALPALTTYLNMWGTDDFLRISDGEQIVTPAVDGHRAHRGSSRG